MKGEVPDHSRFSKNRHAWLRDHDAFRQLFDSVFGVACLKAGTGRRLRYRRVHDQLSTADAYPQRSKAGDEPIDWGNPEMTSHSVREYLSTLERENPVSIPKCISLTDPGSTSAAANGPTVFAYSTNYHIDLKAGVIVDVEESTVSKRAEVEATRTMIDRVEVKSGSKSQRVVGDTN